MAHSDDEDDDMSDIDLKKKTGFSLTKCLMFIFK